MPRISQLVKKGRKKPSKKVKSAAMRRSFNAKDRRSVQTTTNKEARNQCAKGTPANPHKRLPKTILLKSPEILSEPIETPKSSSP